MRARADTTRPRALTAGEIAWFALVPCALATLAVIVVLGPPLGHALFRPGTDMLWPPGWWESEGHPEPTQHARYLLAILAPVALVVAIFWTVRRRPRGSPHAIAAITLASQAVALAFVGVAVLGQPGVIAAREPLPPIFGVHRLLIAATFAAVAALLLRRVAWTRAIAWLRRETRAHRLLSGAVVASLSAWWLLEALTRDRFAEDIGQLNWTLNDAFAVLDGRDPLVNYHAIYAKLLPYPAALALKAFGPTALAYSATMAVLSFLALLAVYGVFRRIVRSSPLALALFVPFVALGNVGHIMKAPAMWPMRYGGAYLLAWLSVRQVDRHGRAWPIFLIGGVVAINAVEFGVAALLATVVALLCPRPRRPLRLATEAVAGIAGAVALVSLFTVVRAGALPDPGLLVEWPRIFANLGWFSLPIPTVGLHLALYATFVAAIGVAAVRLSGSDDDVRLTSMLAWSGVFGLLAGSYYIGRPEDGKLLSLFSAWAFALALLTVVAVRGLTARQRRWPTVPQLLVLFGFGLGIIAIVRFPLPQAELARLSTDAPPGTYRPAAEAFVGARTHRGERVAILFPESYRIAYDLGLRNIAPYGLQNAVVTFAQMRRLIATVRHERVNEVFVPFPGSRLAAEGDTAVAQVEALRAAGYPPRSSQEGFLELRKVSGRRSDRRAGS